MVYTFPVEGVKRLVELTESAGEHHVPYTGGDWGVPEDNSPGLMLVGDHGVYLMSNARGLKKDESGKLPLCYATECNPETMDFDDWWEAKNEGFGGDDGVEFLTLEAVEKWIAQCDGPTLSMDIGPNCFVLESSNTGHRIR